ncbi:hypothetical protein R8Z57_07515 [Microbacterium sp. M3]|uniref:DUF3592 domain-containing protein n=1 Tax=Microbacterium arthrosphaerae TaxID=792652 RepID=A0ABU4GZY9_9MICO|nr:MULTISPECIES: hypothetical protein [Microbacterium]MDW4572623.1 hypothetical protein [Microbacterium arthrosphaerae]MDW7606478.1 hypothetical protein [Microbacterium sp. M3]
MDWGSVAEWVAAIGTVGALLLGIGLFARERAIGRRKSVDDLVTWLSWREVPDREQGVRLETTVHICNRGSRAVYAPLLFYPDARGGYGSEIVSADGRPTMLAPGVETQHVVQGVPRNTIARYVMMTSDEGRVWIRKVDEHRYANAVAHMLLVTLLVLFERSDGASPRRRRQQAKRGQSTLKPVGRSAHAS